MRRDCCTAGEGLEQARGEFVAAVAKGWERGEVVNACDAAANGRDGSGDVATAAALLRMGGGRGGCCTGEQKGVRRGVRRARGRAGCEENALGGSHCGRACAC